MSKQAQEKEEPLSLEERDLLKDMLLDAILDRVATATVQAFDQRKTQLALELRTRLGGGVPGASIAESESSADWEEIESLSRLRGIVGGRFQNLKKRWIDAGLPLREHRGDKSSDYTINDDGWVELSSWILKQGFESRLTPDKSECLFEIRKRAE